MEKYTKIRNIVSVVLVSAMILGFSLWAMIKPADSYSDAERRPLATFPELTIESIFAKDSFMSRFEGYAADQFPLREPFRKINAAFNKYVLGQKTVNDIYIYDGYAAKMEYQISQEDLDYSVERIQRIYDMYLEDSKVYISIIPDKNHYLSKESGSLALNYESFTEQIKAGAPFAEYIEIEDTLSADSYYKTDTHWKQEKLTDTTKRILAAMNMNAEGEYTSRTFSENFLGVYAGQASMKLEADTLCYLTGGNLDKVKVSVFDSGKEETIELYDFKKGEGKDPYELYLSGSRALVEIKNEEVDTGRELVIFRDSFGSSIAPLLVADYEKVTVVDTRYITPMVLGNYVDFKGADVLFLYSTTMLNSSIGQMLP